MNACWSWSAGSVDPSSALPAFEIQATHCPLPDNAGIMCIPPCAPLARMLIVSVENGDAKPGDGP